MSRRRRKTAALSEPPKPDVSASEPPEQAGAARDGWNRLTLSAELVEDAHLGSGSGGGGIDALVARDREGRPVIWASHVEGVLRDAARRLFGEQVEGDFFGRAGGHQQRAVFTSLYTTTTSGYKSRVWQSTARAAFDNRAPDDEKLRAVECIPKGTLFKGSVQICDEDQPRLCRLLQEVDAVGSGRATGAGRVKWSLAEATSPPPRGISGASGRLLLLLRNLDPLCITATATPDNLIPSLAFVPGRALLGALAGWLVAEGYREAATLLVSGRVSVSDALPVPGRPKVLSTAEVLPAPLSLQHVKPVGVGGPVPWWAQDPLPVHRVDSREREAGEPKLKRPENDLFVYRSTPEDAWVAFRPNLRVRLRNGRPDPAQPDPALFAIEQIAEATFFLCEVRGSLADMENLAAGLKPVLDGRRWLRVGRAGAPVEIVAVEWPRQPEPVQWGPDPILTLTSDLLVRDDCLRWFTTLDDAGFRGLPGWPTNVAVQPVMQETEMVHGFNGTSRLWRMPAYGIRRGSVFKVTGTGVTALADMVAQGRWLGERTHEGFGRFRLDDTLPGVTDGMAASAQPSARTADDPEEAVAETTCQWFEAHRALAEAGRASDRRPSLSQWFHLVSDLEREDRNALTSRMHSTTAAGMSWRHHDARAILDRLAALPTVGDRKSHARLFVRWLRAEMRGRRA